MEILTKRKLSHKIITFIGDNCNTYFASAARKGTTNVSPNQQFLEFLKCVKLESRILTLRTNVLQF